ncbi:MAG: PEP-CTERM sorting domain-containing protein [Pseudomonadota bacterium]
MKKLIKAIVFCFLAIPFYANAIVITDMVSINRNLNGGVSVDFDLRRQGYNHETDTIRLVTLSYNFREIIEYDDIDDPSTWESTEIYSLLFDGRAFFRDISTENYTQRLSWQKDYSCQRSSEDDEICFYNLDLFGNTTEFLRSYTDNLWLLDGTLSVEVDRVSVPEPSPFILLCMGLVAILTLNRFRKS